MKKFTDIFRLILEKIYISANFLEITNFLWNVCVTFLIFDINYRKLLTKNK